MIPLRQAIRSLSYTNRLQLFPFSRASASETLAVSNTPNAYSRCLVTCSANTANVVRPRDCAVTSVRHKSKKKSKNYGAEEESSDEEEEEIVLERGPDYRDTKARVQTLRLDALAKIGFNLSRSKTEKEFYSNNFRMNGKKIEKKSASLSIGDTLDFIKDSGSSATLAPGNIEVARLELRHVGGFSDGSDSITVVVRRYPKLVISRDDIE